MEVAAATTLLDLDRAEITAQRLDRILALVLRLALNQAALNPVAQAQWVPQSAHKQATRAERAREQRQAANQEVDHLTQAVDQEVGHLTQVLELVLLARLLEDRDRYPGAASFPAHALAQPLHRCH